VLDSFNGTNGSGPDASLITDSAGDLFGTTNLGGSSNKGSVFEIVKSGSGYSSTPTVLASFTGTSGSSLFGSLYMDASGNLFGTASTGGANNKGSVFEVAKSGSGYGGTPILLASFNGSNGASPEGGLITDTAGDLFGTTVSGGSNNDGTVFEIAKNGSGFSNAPILIAAFNGTTGQAPHGSLIMDSSGDLFGTTANGGANNQGTLFEIVKNGSTYSSTPTVLASFGGSYGNNPVGSLIVDASGDLFGTASAGGASNHGTVFELVKTANGYSTPTVLTSFNGTNGQDPQGSLIMDSAGNLYGTTSSGGANNDGTLFEITKTANGYSGTPTVLTSFNGANGKDPQGSLIMDSAGDLFGTTAAGGSNSKGTVFELATRQVPVPTVDSTTTVTNTDPPVAPVVKITSAAEASNVASQTITGSVTSADATVVGRTVTLTDNGTTLATTTVGTNGTFSAAVKLPNQGANSIVASVTDSLGLTGSSAAVLDTLDNIAPSLTITNAPVPGRTGAQTVSGTVASGGAAAVIGQAVNLTDNGAALGKATVQSNGTFSMSVTLPNQNNNEILASVTDSYGNTNNTYIATKGSGQISITAPQAVGTANDLDFTGGVTDENLWFLQSGSDLKIDILGTSNNVTVKGWFSSTPTQLQEITAGGLKIDSEVSQLVQAMATYSANNPGFNPTSPSITMVPNDASLQSTVAAAWHS
jgi:uncharacterized repeat protein (TIGR03803 family)